MTPDSSGITDFLGQISGLLALTCGAGVLWIILMAVVSQRAAERRRRAQQGLPPLPGLHTQALNWLQRQFGGTSSPAGRSLAAPSKLSDPARPARSAVPQPDLALLTGNLGSPSTPPDMPGGPEPGDQATDTPAWDDLAPVHAPPSDRSDDTPDDTADDMPDDARGDELLDDTPADTPDDMADDDSREVDDDYTPAQTVDADAAAASDARAQAPDEPPPDAVEVMRVWRDLADGGLVLEIGGQRYRSSRDLRAGGAIRRFESVVNELQSLTGEAPPPARPAPASPDPDPALPPERSPSFLRQMTRVAMGQGSAAPEPAELTIAEQIEALLQARLADRPTFAPRDIHVMPTAAGGLRIEVDDESFDSIGAISDPEVRALLQDVVAEWERRQ